MSSALATPCRCGLPMRPSPRKATFATCDHCDTLCTLGKKCPLCKKQTAPEPDEKEN